MKLMKIFLFAYFIEPESHFRTQADLELPR